MEAHIIVSGRVQGVGFRYSVNNFARHLGLNGWVRNLPNGSVEMLVEGEKAAIEQLCELIEKRFQGYIRNKKISFRPSEGNFNNFEITF